VDDAVVTLQAQFPDHVFSQIGNVDAPQDSERLAWALGPPAPTAPDHRTGRCRRERGADLGGLHLSRPNGRVTRERRNVRPDHGDKKMSHQQNIAIAQKLLEGIGSGRDPAEIAASFDANLRFEIQGDDGVLPWIGRKTGRQAVADFIRDIRALTEPVTFEIEDILASKSRAAIIGALQTRIKATGKITATQFAIILTISGDVVTRFQMLEDSFDVSKAARSKQ
jgi:ketosteroid isomerase-like protein